MSAQAMPGPWQWWLWRDSCNPFDPGRLAGLAAEAASHFGGHGHRHGGRGRRGWQGGWQGGGFPGPGFGRGPRVGRGDVREAVLALLAEQPMHGYQMIGELAERSDGAWRPSPGSVYPVLAMLADEGLVHAEEADGKRVFHLTEAGRAYVASRAGEPKPWETAAAAMDDDVTALRTLAFGIGAAVVQVAQTGSEEQIEAARAVLAEARRALYRILADDIASPTGASGAEDAPGPE